MVMERKKASDFPQPVLDLFDGYVHGTLSRRDFIDRARKYAVGGVSAVAMLEMLRPNFAWAQQVAKDDPRIKAEYLPYPSPQGSGAMRGYLARPAAGGKVGCVVVYHENRGLNPYAEDVVRRLATEGFVAFAPDALASVGGYPGDEDKGRALYASLDPKKRTEDMMAGVPYIRSRPECNGKTGVVGFCSGGTFANMAAARYPDLAAAVPYYGDALTAEETPRVKAPLQIHHAGLDQRNLAAWPAWETALKANGIKYEMFVYPGANHGFHNDTTPRYDEAAAKLAWSRTLAFFKEKLG
jgi:carboxymethylenebutenolidase